jgi:hypothetical protein
MFSACVMLVVPVREKPAPITPKWRGSAAVDTVGTKESNTIRTLLPLLALAPHKPSSKSTLVAADIEGDLRLPKRTTLFVWSGVVDGALLRL